nr:hypothetical protein [Rickettsia endosymbiont of Ceutorhynchus assimilis]
MENKDNYTDNFIINASLYPNWQNSKKSFFTICIDEKLEPFNIDWWQEIANKFQQLTKAKHGYYYRRHLKFESDAYATGGNVFFLTEEEKLLCSIWGYKAFMYDRGVYLEKLYKTGNLRDIYPLNFLSKVNLDWQVSSNQTLESWINCNPKHGNLKKLSDYFWSWQVEEDQILNIRRALDASEIIVCSPTRLKEAKIEKQKEDLWREQFYKK